MSTMRVEPSTQQQTLESSLKITKAFVLGAGLGLRLRPLTFDRPKPVLPILGRPLVDYIFEHLKLTGVKEIVINTHHCPEVYSEMMGKKKYLGVKLHYSYEKELLDTGGGLKKVEPYLRGGTFIVYNGDILTDGDLKKAIQFHRERSNLSTLILIPCGPNPNVSLSQEGRITDLRGILGCRGDQQCTFSGIHIMEPEIFRHIPEGLPVSIIDIYLKLIQQGERIGGFVWKDCFWRDIGDLSTYQDLQRELLECSFKNPFPVHRLGQDGSDRMYFRSPLKSNSLIHMRYGKEKEENSFYVRIASFLRDLSLPVPEVYYSDPQNGIVWVEDLGDQSLCRVVHEGSKESTLSWYERVIEEIIKLHRFGRTSFDQNSFPLSASFTKKTYLWESRYFEENLLGDMLHFEFQDDLKVDFDKDCESLAECLSNEKVTLIHRDLQSKNIMIHKNRPYFIDFQGMRFGLPAYDLAALLYDPYVPLNKDNREYLYLFYLQKAGAELIEDPDHFKTVYHQVILQRLMQALGAYGFLGLKKGKTHFLEYIPQALINLDEVLQSINGLDGLRKVVKNTLQLIHRKHITIN